MTQAVIGKEVTAIMKGVAITKGVNYCNGWGDHYVNPFSYVSHIGDRSKLLYRSYRFKHPPGDSFFYMNKAEPQFLAYEQQVGTIIFLCTGSW